MWKRKPKEAEAGKITYRSKRLCDQFDNSCGAVYWRACWWSLRCSRRRRKIYPAGASRAPENAVEEAEGESKRNGEAEADTANCDEDEVGKHADIQLPELSGVADGLSTGLGGFDLMPDLNEMTLFGGGQTIGNDFVGTFYDFKNGTGRDVQFLWIQHSFQKTAGLFEMGFDPLGWLNFIDPRRSYMQRRL